MEPTEPGTALVTWQSQSAGSCKGSKLCLYCTHWPLTLSLALDPGAICPCHSPPHRHGSCTFPTSTVGGPPRLHRDHMIGEPRSLCPCLGCRRSWESKYLSGSDSIVGGGLCLSLKLIRLGIPQMLDRVSDSGWSKSETVHDKPSSHMIKCGK